MTSRWRGMAGSAIAAAQLREIVRGDTRQIATFLSTHFAEFGSDAWERALTHMLWDNPSSAQNSTMGWILEHPVDGIVGFLGNIPHPFHVLDGDVRAAATTAWCVAPRHRSLGLLLAEAFLEQEGADLLVSTTANPVSGALFERLGFKRVQPETLGNVLYWVTNPARFVRGATLHAMGSRAMATAAAIGGSVPLWLVERLRSGASGMAPKGSGAFSTLDKFDREWDQCWERWRTGLITGVRTARQMRWRLSRNTQTIAIRGDSGEYLGYAALRVVADYGGALTRLRVIDLWSEPGRPEVIRSLIGASRKLAADTGCGSIEVFGMSEAVRAALAPMRPRVRALSTWPYYIRARGRTLAASLDSAKQWHATEYDGDSPFAAATA